MEQWIDYGRYVLAAIATALTAFLGGWDTALQVLVTLVIVDYVTGIIAAGFRKELSAEIGARGIAKKVMVFVLVGVAATIDKILGGGDQPILRTVVAWFYAGNEGISILRNASEIGLPVPEPLKKALYALKSRGNGDEE